ncbi:hypothetical protein MYBA111488_24830 [Mycobacterium basiliense]
MSLAESLSKRKRYCVNRRVSMQLTVWLLTNIDLLAWCRVLRATGSGGKPCAPATAEGAAVAWGTAMSANAPRAAAALARRWEPAIPPQPSQPVPPVPPLAPLRLRPASVLPPPTLRGRIRRADSRFHSGHTPQRRRQLRGGTGEHMPCARSKVKRALCKTIRLDWYWTGSDARMPPMAAGASRRVNGFWLTCIGA